MMRRVLYLGKYFDVKRGGFWAWGGGQAGLGLGLEFAIALDHVYLNVRVLDRTVNVQYERDWTGA